MIISLSRRILLICTILVVSVAWGQAPIFASTVSVPKIASTSSVVSSVKSAHTNVERWDFFELKLAGPVDGNPFTDVTLWATFMHGQRTVQATGFYDGDGIYKIRFMPEVGGEWRYETTSNRPELQGKTGIFTVTAASAGNHGPVRVRNTFHFAYADDTPFRQIGTTSYAWMHHGDVLQEQTLKTLATTPFNKLRMAIFPQRQNHPVSFPFAGTPPTKWDFTRFNPAYFRHVEQRIGQLRALGIEADIILFHPYDKGQWGFDRMPAEADDRYLRYVVARLAAYRNVWWSMANEFDFMTEKTAADWDRFFQIVQSSDPYDHLRSIHNGMTFYNQTQPWVTHASIQSGSAAEDFGRAAVFRDVYRKPIVFDEVKYEGNLPQRWGQLSAEEMVLRFWEGTIAGTYVGHSESYLDAKDGSTWLDKGGVLRGQSVARIAFLRKIMEEGPADGLDPIDPGIDYPFAGKRGTYYLAYFGRENHTTWPFALYKAELKDGMKFKVEVIDTWNMTITPVNDVFEVEKKDNYMFVDKEGRSVTLPDRPYMALRITRQP